MSERDLILELLQQLREDMHDGFTAIQARMDAMNGRTREAEQAIAVLTDRASKSVRAGRLWGGLAGAIGTAIASMLAYWSQQK